MTSAFALLAAGCAGGDNAETTDAAPDPTQPEAMSTSSHLVDLLSAGEAVFGIFSGDHTPEQGAVMAQNAELDFVFYSLESGPFDIPAMEAYMGGLASASGPTGPHPIALRVPPIRDDAAAARTHVAEGLAAGAATIVFPHVSSSDDASLAVAALGGEAWPTNPDGTTTNVLIIEDKEAIPYAREIAGVPGVGVVIPGPGDLSRSFEGDMEAVEGAIQEVLSVCKELGVPCGITAGADDIAERIEQGFKMIIVTEPEALAIGRAAAGRTE